MRFFLGTHEAAWLKRTDVPLFVSRRRLARLKVAPRAIGPWALDSGGFTELSMFGRWETAPKQYALEALQWQAEVGNLAWAAIQDWMCEPWILEKTGLSVREHQSRSIESYLTLRDLAPAVPWSPVLQGWLPDDYLFHVEQYTKAGVNLEGMPAVGVGTLCRRQATRQVEDILVSLRPLGLRLHGFGLKKGFIRLAFDHGLESCDSMAWSFRARRSPPLPGCTHKSCANCFRYAMRWREEVVRLGRRPRQMVAVWG